MKNISIFAFSFVLLFGLLAAAPQDTHAACTSLTRYLYMGERDADTNGQVTKLQDFLRNRGHLDSESTGYYGPMTRDAVRLFQTAQGIDPLGYVGPRTQAAIRRLSCDIAPFPNPTPATPKVPDFIFSSSTATSTIMYLDPYSAGAVGDEITIYGGYFPSTENRVRIDGLGTIANLRSADNNTITFTIPKRMETWCSQTGECEEYIKKTEPGMYQLTVRNKNGISNPVQFTIIPGKKDPKVDSVSPQSGPVGTTIVIKGDNFTTTGNTIHFAEAGDIFEIYSPDGETLMFQMPGGLLPRCVQRAACKANVREIIPGPYELNVKNARGSSKSFEFRVTR